MATGTNAIATVIDCYNLVNGTSKVGNNDVALRLVTPPDLANGVTNLHYEGTYANLPGGVLKYNGTYSDSRCIKYQDIYVSAVKWTISKTGTTVPGAIYLKFDTGEVSTPCSVGTETLLVPATASSLSLYWSYSPTTKYYCITIGGRKFYPGDTTDITTYVGSNFGKEYNLSLKFYKS